MKKAEKKKKTKEERKRKLSFRDLAKAAMRAKKGRVAQAAPEEEAIEEPTPEDPPESAEVAAKSPEVPWPSAGVRVAVGVEHLCHYLRMGDRGVSQGPAVDNAGEIVVEFDALTVMTSLRVPRQILVPEGKNMRQMRWWDKMSDALKKGILLQIGVSDPRLEALPRTSTVSLTAWGEFLSLGLGIPADAEDNAVKFVHPDFVRHLFQDGESIKRAEAGDVSVSFADLEEIAKRQDVRLKMIKHWWEKHEVLLIVMVSEENMRSGLLALRKDPPSVRFYEAEEPAGLILRQIEAVAEALDGCFAAEDIARTNVASGQDSEVLIAHYLEGEYREGIGETRGCVGWPSRNRLKVVRGWLTGLRSSLETFRKKWCAAEDAREAHRSKITMDIALKALRNDERRKVFEARRAEVEERHLKALHEGTYDGPIVPIGLRPPEPPKVRNKKKG